MGGEGRLRLARTPAWPDVAVRCACSPQLSDTRRRDAGMPSEGDSAQELQDALLGRVRQRQGRDAKRLPGREGL